MTQEDQQNLLDAHFPEGALVVLARTTEEAAWRDESDQHLTDRVRVMGIEDDGDLEVSFWPLGMNREIRAVVSSLEPRDYGIWAESAENPGQGWVISNRLGESHKKAVAIQREQDKESW